jgi:hypothetical protein
MTSRHASDVPTGPSIGGTSSTDEAERRTIVGADIVAGVTLA